MRRLLLRERAQPQAVLVALAMEEAVWEDGYRRVMRLPADRPLVAFWRHYYGSSAEMLLTPELLPALLDDLDLLLQDASLPPPMTAFLHGMRALGERALHLAATTTLSVIAD